MTQLLVAGGLGQAFRHSANTAAYLKHFARQQEEERLRRDRKEDLASETSEVFDFALAVITASEAAELRFELDLYGTGSVAALQQNEIELADVQKRLDKIFAKSYTLPDGRKVWKTADGSEVYDERGEKLDLSVIDPAEIADEYPKWETVKPMLDERELLLKERTEILDYQDKLDAARDRLDSGNMTRKEFEELREELKADMPDAVRAQIPGMEAEPSQDHAAAPAEELDLSDDMVPTAPIARISTPNFGG
ncbi:hypothetical protein KYK29_15625 [Shinella daejeonensis]|uniref:hypothetical protein n=1 Tax=Shinella daejeonensis TaxID=659017 RepID=UPI0020C79B7E|nr:hypothetical protein [Shinella daejeonensis]MCP8896357.1 hypothetical protein [Shinella daejeonensis]